MRVARLSSAAGTGTSGTGSVLLLAEVPAKPMPHTWRARSLRELTGF